MKSMQSSPRKTVNLSAGKPRNRTARETHPQHHTPLPQSVEIKLKKGEMRQKRRIVRTEKRKSRIAK